MGLHIRTACILMPSYIVEMGRSEICEDHWKQTLLARVIHGIPGNFGCGMVLPWLWVESDEWDGFACPGMSHVFIVIWDNQAHLTARSSEPPFWIWFKHVYDFLEVLPAIKCYTNWHSLSQLHVGEHHDRTLCLQSHSGLCPGNGWFKGKMCVKEYQVSTRCRSPLN